MVVVILDADWPVQISSLTRVAEQPKITTRRSELPAPLG